MGRHRVYTVEESQARKRAQNERWKHDNWDYYVAQKKAYAATPAAADLRRRRYRALADAKRAAEGREKIKPGRPRIMLDPLGK